MAMFAVMQACECVGGVGRDDGEGAGGMRSEGSCPRGVRGLPRKHESSET